MSPKPSDLELRALNMSSVEAMGVSPVPLANAVETTPPVVDQQAEETITIANGPTEDGVVVAESLPTPELVVDSAASPDESSVTEASVPIIIGSGVLAHYVETPPSADEDTLVNNSTEVVVRAAAEEAVVDETTPLPPELLSSASVKQGEDAEEPLNISPPEHTHPEATRHPQENEPGEPQTAADATDLPPPDEPPTTRGFGELEPGEPLLPETDQDRQWIDQYGGQVIITTDPRIPGAEVVKIYHPPGDDHPGAFNVETPSGLVVSTGVRDIIHVYERDAEGRIGAQPTVIFQPGDRTPDGYAARSNSWHIIDMINERRQAGYGEAPISPFIEAGDSFDLERYSYRTPPLDGRVAAPRGLLAFLSEVMQIRSSAVPSQHSYMRHNLDQETRTSLVHYPMHGTPLKVVLPTGGFIDGQANDIIEIVRQGELGGYRTVRRTFLRTLAQEEGYMVLGGE